MRENKHRDSGTGVFNSQLHILASHFIRNTCPTPHHCKYLISQLGLDFYS